jgi:hypothetical protein
MGVITLTFKYTLTLTRRDSRKRTGRSSTKAAGPFDREAFRCPQGPMGSGRGLDRVPKDRLSMSDFVEHPFSQKKVTHLK